MVKAENFDFNNVKKNFIHIRVKRLSVGPILYKGINDKFQSLCIELPDGLSCPYGFNDIYEESDGCNNPRYSLVMNLISDVESEQKKIDNFAANLLKLNNWIIEYIYQNSSAFFGESFTRERIKSKYISFVKNGNTKYPLGIKLNVKNNIDKTI